MVNLPYGRHQIDDDDIDAVVEVLRGDALTAGPKAGEFENAFAAKIGAREAVVCSNGTTALHLAALALDFGSDDLAIVPSITFLSTANAIRMTGAHVVFADVDENTGLMTPETLDSAYKKAGAPVKAVLPVHLNGQCADISIISEIAAQKGSKVITDCCHALGAEYESGGRPGDGQFEDLACFSLHPVKSIAMGEGGVITTNNSALAHRMRLLRSHDMKRDPASWQLKEMAFDDSGEVNPWFYEMHELAYNYRATDIQCALGLSQLNKLDDFIARRREIADLYEKLLRPLGNFLRPISRTTAAKSAWHLFPVLIDFDVVGKGRRTVMQELLEAGIGSQVHYVPVSDQPYYRSLYGEQRFAGVDQYYSRALSLPIFPAMSDDDVVGVVANLEKILL